MFFHQFAAPAPTLGQRQPAQGADEGNGFDRLHGRIEAAFLGQVSDQVRNIVRPLGPEHPAGSFVRVDDPQQHAQGGGLARAVRPEHAVNSALGHGKVDPAHGGKAVEPLYQPTGVDRQGHDCARVRGG